MSGFRWASILAFSFVFPFYFGGVLNPYMRFLLLLGIVLGIAMAIIEYHREERGLK